MGGMGGEVRLCDKPVAWRIRLVEEAPCGPLLVRDGRLIVAVHPRSCLGAWRQATGAGSASGTQLHLSEIQVELACWGNQIWQHGPDGRIVPRRCRSSA